MLGPGDVLGDRYRLDEFVASGGMGQVWRATDTVLNRIVAVKVLLPGLTSDDDFGMRFRAEARIMASLGHPGVVGVYDYGESREGTLYLVMAFVHGQSLGEVLKQQGTLPVEQTLSVVAQAADALHAAHTNGIIHRDVKPGNLLINNDGEVTLVDFGVARSAAVTSVTKVNAMIGTALYMSPEQASGKPISAATDIYALGAVAYHLLAGRPPFVGNSPLEIALKHLQDEPPPLPADLPVGVLALVERALAKDADARYPTAAAMAVAARGAQSATIQDLPLVRPEHPVQPRRVPIGAAPVRRRRNAWVPLAVGLALLVVVGGVLLTVLALARHAKRVEVPAGVPAVSTSPTHSAPVKAKPTGKVSSAPTTAPPTSAAPSLAPSSAAPQAPVTPTKGPTTPAADPATTKPASPAPDPDASAAP